tara:strand:- start:70 stop:342 length:273 start_codon:yes stop_codon:yes gene_type:complete
MEFDMNTYPLLLEWASSKEGILLCLILVYFAYFFMPAVQTSFIASEGEKTDLLTKVIVFLVVFLVLPPLLILGIILNFLGLLGEEEGVEV